MSTFSDSMFEKKLLQLRETHESISNLSSWCLTHQSHHSKIVNIWLNVLRRVKIEHRLLLFYLANDVVQYSRRKHLPFVESFAPALQKATTMVREDSVKNKILRLFKIWDDRGIYDEAFLLDLSGLLICDPKGGNRMDIQDFQPNVMYSRIRSCKKLEDDTDLKLKILNESSLPLTDVDRLRKSLKDREQGEDVMEDVEQALKKIKAYVDALEAEIKERSGLLDMLDTGEQYYDKDLREAKIVVNAYKCFGQRVKQVQKNLEEKIPSLPSPIPSPPDINAPSPSPPISPPDTEDKDNEEFNANSFTVGESFINNTGAIEKALDSQNSSFYSNTSTGDYYIPPVYNPSMTTGASRDGDLPYLPSIHYPPTDTSFNNSTYDDQIDSHYNNTTDEHYSTGSARNSQFNSDSQASNTSDQSYSAEYFIGANSSDATPYYSGKGEERKPLAEDGRMDSSVFSSLMDSKGGLLPPPPPPPPPPASPPACCSSPGENKIEVIGGSTKQLSLTDILSTLLGKQQPSIVKQESDVSGPLKPPPMPPSGLQEEEDNWRDRDEWDSPMSPTPFQDFPSSDTDMRPKDIDHRNLISLTGWDTKPSEDNSMDKDERAFPSYRGGSDSSNSRSPPDHIPPLNLPPPVVTVDPPSPLVTSQPPPTTTISLPSLAAKVLLPPPEIPCFPPPDFMEEALRSRHSLDNVENIDMEMSDEEDRREKSPARLGGAAARGRGGLVSLTSLSEGKQQDMVRGIPPPDHPLIPIPPPSHQNSSPSLNSHLDMFSHMPLMDTPPPPRHSRMQHRLLSPNPSGPGESWLPPPPSYSPHPPLGRPPHPGRPHPHMFQSPPRQHFFNQGHRPFRPRHLFRPRFQQRW